MGYYSDTTKKLLSQIGEPYVTKVSGGGQGGGLDLSSLIMALMFLPQTQKAGMAVNPVADSLAMLGARKYASLPEEIVPPERQFRPGQGPMPDITGTVSDILGMDGMQGLMKGNVSMADILTSFFMQYGPSLAGMFGGMF